MFVRDTGSYEDVADLDYSYLQDKVESSALRGAYTSTYVDPRHCDLDSASFIGTWAAYPHMQLSASTNRDASVAVEATYVDPWPCPFDPTFDPIFDLVSDAKDAEHQGMLPSQSAAATHASEYMDYNMDIDDMQDFGTIASSTQPDSGLSDLQSDIEAISIAYEDKPAYLSGPKYTGRTMMDDAARGYAHTQPFSGMSWPDLFVVPDMAYLGTDADVLHSSSPPPDVHHRRDSILDTSEVRDMTTSGPRLSKLHHCPEPSCKSVGFAYQFDLQRHRRTVHKKESTGYRCALPGCPKADKLWIRHDNYKKHVKTHHEGVEYTGLKETIKSSRPNMDSRFPFSITTPQMIRRRREEP